MWFTRFGEYVNQGWRQASLIALIFSFIPFFGWVGTVIMALITMRKGAKPGAIVLLATLIPSLVLLIVGVNIPWVIVSLLGSLLTFGLALILRAQASWGSVLSACIIATIVLAFALSLIFPDLQNYWYMTLSKIYSQTDKDVAFLIQQPPADMNLQTYLKNVAKIVTPLMIWLQVMAAIVNLGLARWWQGSLFNPGGFTAEILSARLNYVAAVLTVLTMGAIYLGARAGWDVLPTILTVFFAVGIIVFHSIIKQQKSKTLWLWLFYGLTVLLFPYSMIVIAGLGITDTFVDFRARYAS